MAEDGDWVTVVSPKNNKNRRKGSLKSEESTSTPTAPNVVTKSASGSSGKNGSEPPRFRPGKIQKSASVESANRAVSSNNGSNPQRKAKNYSGSRSAKGRPPPGPSGHIAERRASTDSRGKKQMPPLQNGSDTYAQNGAVDKTGRLSPQPHRNSNRPRSEQRKSGLSQNGSLDINSVVLNGPSRPVVLTAQAPAKASFPAPDYSLCAASETGFKLILEDSSQSSSNSEQRNAASGPKEMSPLPPVSVPDPKSATASSVVSPREVTPVTLSSPHSTALSPNAPEFIPKSSPPVMEAGKAVSATVTPPIQPVFSPPLATPFFPPEDKRPNGVPPPTTAQPQQKEPEKIAAVLQAPTEEKPEPTPPVQEKEVPLLRGPSVSAPEPSSQTETPAAEDPPAEDPSAKFDQWKAALEEEAQAIPEMWNPDNETGLKKYSRDLLLICRDIMEFTQDEIPQENQEAGYVELHCGFRTHDERKSMGLVGRGEMFGNGRPSKYMSQNLGFNVGWNQGGHGTIPRMAPRPGGRNSYGGRPSGGQRGRPSQQKVIARPSQALVQLDKADNAWKPKKTDDLSRDEMLKKKTRGILNKITPQTEEDLTREFLELLFDELQLSSEDDWKVVIDVIFLKAVEEQHFCETYSKLCKAVVNKQLKLRENNPNNQEQNTSSFRNLLLSTCQHKFENVRIDEEDADKEQTKEILEKRNRDRRRIFGNIRFIGELYQQNLLIPMIMHSCVMELFRRITAGFKDNKEAEEDTLECLCRLLSTVGENLSKEKNDKFAHQFPRYFDQLQKIETPSSRIRFKILDLLDLKKGDWKSRRKLEGPKKIGDLHRDHEIEKLTEKEELRNYENQQMRGGGNRGGRGGSLGPRARYQPGMDNRSRQDVKPDRGDRRMAAASASMQAGTRTEKIKSTVGLRGHLNTNEDANQGPSLRPGWGSKQKNRQTQGSPSPGSSRESSQTRKDVGGRADAIKAVQNLRPTTVTTSNKFGGLVNSEMEPEPEIEIEIEDVPADNEALIKKARGTLDELTDIIGSDKGAIKEALTTLQEVGRDLQAFIHHSLSHSVDKKDAHRKALGTLLEKAATTTSFNLDLNAIIDGIEDFVKEADENGLEEDVPKLWSYLSGILRPMLETVPRDDVGIQRLLAALPPKVEIPAIVTTGTANHGAATDVPSSAVAAAMSGLDPKGLELRRLLDGVHAGQNDSDAVIEYIQREFSKEETDSADFIGFLTNAISDSLFSEEPEDVDNCAENFEKHCRVLTRYIDGKQSHQSRMLSTLAERVDKVGNPMNLFVALLNVLSEANVVEAESFKEWWKGKDEIPTMIARAGDVRRFFDEISKELPQPSEE